MTKTAAVLAALLAALLGFVWYLGSRPRSRAVEPRIESALIGLGAAQEDFRRFDRDGNDTHDYWRGELAELHRIYSDLYDSRRADLSDHMATLEPAWADEGSRGDPRFPNHAPCRGYWMRSLRFEGETSPSPDRFAIVASPADYGTARRDTFLLTHERRVYRKDLGPGGRIEACPADPVKEGWEVVIRHWTVDGR